MSILSKLYQMTLRAGLLRFIEPIYNGVIATELMIQKSLDRSTRPFPDQKLGNEITAVVKTFERPLILKRLIDSIRRFYPELPLIVVDDSEYPAVVEGVEQIVLPYDSGVSAGKNAGLDRVRTPYVLMLDDDFIFYRHTQVESSIAVLQRNPEIDILGGEVIDLPFYRCADYRSAGLFPSIATPIHPIGSEIGGFEVFNKLANFYIARTDRLRLVGWDPALKRIDHADFFTRAKGILTSVYNPDFKILHAQNRFDREYMYHRTNFAADRTVIQYKYYRATEEKSAKDLV